MTIMTRNPEKSTDSEKQQLLALLQAHGQNFLSSFGPLPQSASTPSRKRRKIDRDSSVESRTGNDEEWSGFNSQSSADSGSDTSEDDYSDEVEDSEEDDCHDDDFRSDSTNKRQPEVVVFSGEIRSQDSKMSKSQARSLMSSKVSKLRQDASGDTTVKPNNDDSEYEEERTNLENDKILHKLVHTKLLSGSLSSELNLTPAQRRKALEGRILEIADGAKLGRGESIVRQEERKKAAKRVRIGLERKVEERKRKALEEAKDLGNYHHSIKHLFEADGKKRTDRRKRDRGLKLGVGRFSGGVLKLGKDDIASVQGSSTAVRGKSGGRRGSERGRR